MFKLALAESEAVLCADSVQELEAFLGALRGAVEGVSVWRDGDPAPEFGVGQPAPELAAGLERLVEVMV